MSNKVFDFPILFYHDIVNKNCIPDNITIIWNTIRKFIRRKAWGYIQGMLENLNQMYPKWIEYVPYIKLNIPDQENKDNEDFNIIVE